MTALLLALLLAADGGRAPVEGPPLCKVVCRQSIYQWECVYPNGAIEWHPTGGDMLCIDTGAHTIASGDLIMVTGDAPRPPPERFPHTTPENVCPICKRKGQKSVVRYADQFAVTTCCTIYSQSDDFYDPDGKWHSHGGYPCCGDGSTDYSCSNGHSFTIMPAAERCWCGWPVRGQYSTKETP